MDNPQETKIIKNIFINNLLFNNLFIIVGSSETIRNAVINLKM